MYTFVQAGPPHASDDLTRARKLETGVKLSTLLMETNWKLISKRTETQTDDRENQTNSQVVCRERRLESLELQKKTTKLMRTNEKSFIT